MFAMYSNERRAGWPMADDLPFQNVSRCPILVTAGFSARILAESRTLGMLSRYQRGKRGVGELPHGATRGVSLGGLASRSGWLTGRTPCRGPYRRRRRGRRRGHR